MSDQPSSDNQEFHKKIASGCNNTAWPLIEKPDLDNNEITELLTLAATARHHWHAIGNPGNIAHADLLFAWALARTGVGKAAVGLAAKSLSHFEEDGAAWERAFAHAAMAAACSANNDHSGQQKHYNKAEEYGRQLSGPNATYFQAAFDTVPKVPDGA